MVMLYCYSLFILTDSNKLNVLTVVNLAYRYNSIKNTVLLWPRVDPMIEMTDYEIFL